MFCLFLRGSFTQVLLYNTVLVVKVAKEGAQYNSLVQVINYVDIIKCLYIAHKYIVIYGKINIVFHAGLISSLALIFLCHCKQNCCGEHFRIRG